MFAQIIRAEVTDRDAVTAAAERWMQDLAPDARGWLGQTSGVTEDGRLFVMVQFDSEGSARFNSARPEQDQWWSQFSRFLDGEATFQDSNNVLIEATGDLAAAGFIQVIIGQSTNLERSRQLLSDNIEARTAARPDILGSVSVGHEDGKFTHLVYFTSEEEARQGEQKEPPQPAKDVMEEVRSLAAGQPEYLDLRQPRVDTPT